MGIKKLTGLMDTSSQPRSRTIHKFGSPSSISLFAAAAAAAAHSFFFFFFLLVQVGQCLGGGGCQRLAVLPLS